MTDTNPPDGSADRGDGLDPDAMDASDPSSAAAAQQTVVNDAVAGETVTDGAGSVPTAREAAPTSDEHAPANDGYLSPRNETGEAIDLDDSDGETPPIATSQVDPHTQGGEKQ